MSALDTFPFPLKENATRENDNMYLKIGVIN